MVMVVGVVAVLAMLMVVIMVTVVIVAVVVGLQEIGVDLQLGVQVEAAQVEHLGQGHLAEMRRLDRRTRVHVLEAVDQRVHGGRLHEVTLADEDLVGKAHLHACFLAGVELRVGMLGVDQRQHRVQQIGLGDLVVHEKGLGHRAGVGQAGGLDDDALEIELALAALGGQVAQRRAQVLADGAADAAIAHLDDLLVGVRHEDVGVDVLLAELVLDDGDLLAMGLGQHALEQRGFAGTEEAGEDGGGNEAGGLGHDGDRFWRSQRRWGRCAPGQGLVKAISYSVPSAIP
mmetsp:Transcript_53270/g.124867  ORF Transcript_53270/g.124867 Transcript_53270/m.124867 type:complete len:287 (+) Transcript_53270:924-1784(+)